MKWDDLLKWNNLLYLYPNDTPKAEAFSEFYPKEELLEGVFSNSCSKCREYVKIIPVILPEAAQRIRVERNSTDSGISEAGTSTENSPNPNGHYEFFSSKHQNLTHGDKSDHNTNAYWKCNSVVSNETPVYIWGHPLAILNTILILFGNAILRFQRKTLSSTLKFQWSITNPR